MMAALRKNQRKNHNRKVFFLFFLCTFFYTDGCVCSTGGWYHSYGRKECRLLSIASGCFYGASAPEENRVAQKMHAQVEEDTRVRLMDEVIQTEERPQRCFLKTNHCRVLPVFDPLDPKEPLTTCNFWHICDSKHIKLGKNWSIDTLNSTGSIKLERKP